MNICVLIYSYFPFGGQQRDFMRVCDELIKRGHSIEVFTLSWQGEIPSGYSVNLAPVKSRRRLQRYRDFTAWIEKELERRQNHCIVGFNKMPYLDVYFAADPCFLEKAETQRGLYYKFTPRFRHFKKYEEAVFSATSQIEILALTKQQEQSFKHYYPETGAKFTILPAGLAPDRRVAKRDRSKGDSVRSELEIDPNAKLILQIGSGFKVKGVDRSLKAIASLNSSNIDNYHFLLVGEDRSSRFSRLAKSLGILDRVTIVKGRNDIPDILQAADLLLHPAYSESAGYVLLEATVAGLPVLTTASCGYAFHVEQARSGEVCTLPFSQSDLNRRLVSMLERLDSESWSDNGINYGKGDALFAMPSVAADVIERRAKTLQFESH